MDTTLANLIKKYDISGPRYTSYPPAPHFSADFGSKEYKEAILGTEINPPTPDISFYFHIPSCDTLCYFCGCTTVITKNRSQVGIYLEHRKKEIDALAPLINHSRKAAQLHWGGGTPTYLSPDEQIEAVKYIPEDCLMIRR